MIFPREVCPHLCVCSVPHPVIFLSSHVLRPHPTSRNLPGERCTFLSIKIKGSPPLSRCLQNLFPNYLIPPYLCAQTNGANALIVGMSRGFHLMLSHRVEGQPPSLSLSLPSSYLGDCPDFSPTQNQDVSVITKQIKKPRSS